MRKRSPVDSTQLGKATWDRATSCPRMKIWSPLLKTMASNQVEVMARRLQPPDPSLQSPAPSQHAAAAGPAASLDPSECAESSQRNSIWRMFVLISKVPHKVGWWPLNHSPLRQCMRISHLNSPQNQCNESSTGFTVYYRSFDDVDPSFASVARLHLRSFYRIASW